MKNGIFIKFILCVILSILATGLIFPYGTFTLTGFKYFIPFQVKNQNIQDLTDFQVKLNVNTKSLIDQGYVNSDCSDIRFVDPNNNNELPYWIEGGCNTENTTIWVKFDFLPAEKTKEFWMVFGNTSASSESNGDQVFEFFDDFEDGVINTSKWSVNEGVSEITDPNFDIGVLRCEGGNEKIWMSSVPYVSVNSIVGFRMRPESTGDFDSGIKVGNIYFISDTGSYGGSPCIGTSWCYPSGSQGPDTNFHVYEAIITPNNQTLKDLTSGGSETASISYSEGKLSLIGDSDSTSRDTFYDFIYVRKYAPIEPFVIIDISKVEPFDFIDESNYSYKLPIKIYNFNNETLKDFQVKFILNTQKLISLGLMNQDCSDLRVTDQIGVKVPYWIETGTCNTTNTTVWVKALALQPGENTYYVYFGNPNAKSESNGDQVFEFFDDFEGNTLNLSKWTIGGTGNVSVSNGYVELTSDSYIYANFNLSSSLILQAGGIVWSGSGEYAGLGVYSNYQNSIPYLSDNGYGFSYYEHPTWDSSDSTGNRIYQQMSGHPTYVEMRYNGTTIYYNNSYGDTWSRILNLDITSYKLKIANNNANSYKVDYIFIRKYADQKIMAKVNLSNIQTTSPMFYYIKILIQNNQSVNLTEVQIPIYLNETNFDFNLADYTGLTIRVYDKRVSNPYDDINNGWNYQGIPYWIEYFKPKEKKALIWVKINLSANENKTIYIYFSKDEPIRFDVYNPGNKTLENYQIRLPYGVSLDPNRKYKIYLEKNPSKLLPWWSKDNITWIKVSKIDPGDNYLIIKEDENGLSSNGSAVFEFFDDFDGYTLDTTKWQSTNDVALSDSILTVSVNYNDIISKQLFSPNTVIGFKTKVSDNYYNTVLFAVDSPTGYGPGFLIKNGRFYKLKYKYVDTNAWSYGYDTIYTQPTWRIFELYWLPSNSYLMFDTNRKYVNDKNTYQNRSGYIGLGAWDSGAEFDYVYVRKYASPEPIVFIATNANDGYKVFDFFDDFDKPWFNWIRGDSFYGPMQYIVRNGILTTWSSSEWQTLYSPKTWTTNDKIVVEIKDRRDYNNDWHKAYLTDKDNSGTVFRFGVNGADTIQLYGSWANGQGTSSFTNQNFKWYIHQIVINGNHFIMNWLDGENRSLLNWYSADTSTYRNDLVIRQWQYYTYPPAEWDWVKVYKYLDNPPTIKFEKSVVFMIATNNTILANTTVKIYYPTGTTNLIFEGKTDMNGLLYVPIQLNYGYYDIEATVGNKTIKRVGFLINPKGIKNPIIQRIEESIIS